MHISNPLIIFISTLLLAMLLTNLSYGLTVQPPGTETGSTSGSGSGGSGSSSAAAQVISSSLCGIIGTVQTVIGVIALMLFTLGGVLYGIAPLLPAGTPGTSARGALQGWAMGMIVGSVVGLLIVTIAPWIISTIASTASIPFTTCAI